MNSWFVIIVIALAVLLAFLLLGKIRRGGREVVAAAMMLGLAGYAWQGSPAQPGAPAKPAEGSNPAVEGVIRLRADMAPNFDYSLQWTRTADAFARNGKYALASAFLERGLMDRPDNANLWAAKGLYAMLAADGKLLAPAQYAFDRARAANPKHPAPDYFEGLNALVTGDPSQTVEKWTRALENARKDAKWKPVVEQQLAGLLEAVGRASAQTEAGTVGNNNPPRRSLSRANADAATAYAPRGLW